MLRNRYYMLLDLQVNLQVNSIKLSRSLIKVTLRDRSFRNGGLFSESTRSKYLSSTIDNAPSPVKYFWYISRSNIRIYELAIGTFVRVCASCSFSFSLSPSFFFDKGTSGSRCPASQFSDVDH